MRPMSALRWFETSFPIRIGNNMNYYTNAELVDVHFMYKVAQENRLAVQRIYTERFLVGLCRIAERLNVFIRTCAAVNRFMFPDVIRAV